MYSFLYQYVIGGGGRDQLLGCFFTPISMILCYCVGLNLLGGPRDIAHLQNAPSSLVESMRVVRVVVVGGID